MTQGLNHLSNVIRKRVKTTKSSIQPNLTQGSFQEILVQKL